MYPEVLEAMQAVADREEHGLGSEADFSQDLEAKQLIFWIETYCMIVLCPHSPVGGVTPLVNSDIHDLIFRYPYRESIQRPPQQRNRLAIAIAPKS